MYGFLPLFHKANNKGKLSVNDEYTYLAYVMKYQRISQGEKGRSLDSPETTDRVGLHW